MTEASPERPRHRARRAVGTTLLVVSWLVITVLGSVALLRLVAWDTDQPLVVLDALTLVVYLPAWLVAAGAVITRRWCLTAAAAIIVAAS